MMDSKADPRLQISGLLMGFVASRALQVAAEIGLADALAERPKDADALARELGAHADTVRRLLRALVGFGAFDQLADGRFANTPLSDCLRSDGPRSVRGLARMYGDPAFWHAWEALEHTVRTGQASFEHLRGETVFDYLAAHPDSARRFDAAMTNSSNLINQAVVEAYDWSRFGTVVDVAGGAGSTLAAILHANPASRGVLYDLPHVIERGREYLTREGLAERCITQSGSFFDAVPAGADAYFIKHIIHDWSDEDCLRILRRCRAAMPDHARLLICEKIVPPGNEPSVAKIADLVMLVLTHGGRERTEPEFRDLFERADLNLARIVPTKSDDSLLEVTK